MKDFDRPLDPQGHASLDRLAAAMKAADLFPQRVVLSASRRTRETAFGLIERLGRNIEAITDEGLYGSGAAAYVKSIRAHGGDVENLMLVGHNPSIEDLALALCRSGDAASLERLRAGFPPAALAVISLKGSLTQLHRESGSLESFPLPDYL